MTQGYILGIDQGTTGSTAILISDHGKFLGSFTADVPQHFPRPGWVEHDPREIWASIQKAVRGILRKTKIHPRKILGIGFTNQRETVSLFRNEKPLHRFIVWQDRRTAENCESLKIHEAKIQALSGLPVDPYFSGSKIKWLLDHLQLSGKESGLKFRTIDSYILSRLSGTDATEVTNASRTSLMNLKKCSWDAELFSIFGIPESLAPKIIPSEGFRIYTKNSDLLPDGIPIMSCLGDQQAALFGQCGWTEGAGKITFGTGSFILLNTGSMPIISKESLVSTVALQRESGEVSYALEGSAFICGAWIQWLRDHLQIIAHARASEAIAKKANDSGGVLILPALSGMGAPFWKPHLRGIIAGLTRGSTKAHILRASLEALCFQNKALVDAMKKDLPNLQASWRVDGGAVKNNLLMQIQADVLRQEVIRPKNLEATATGVALLAATSLNLMSLSEIQKTWKKDRIFRPSKTSYDEVYTRWLKLIAS